MRKLVVLACLWGARFPASALTLEEAVDVALRHSPTAAAAEATYLSARADLWQGWANLLPSASATYGTSRYYDRDSYRAGGVVVPNYTPPTRGYYASLEASQPLFAGGALIYGVRSGYASARAGEAGRREQRDRLVVDVAKAYVAVLTADGLKGVAEANLAANVHAEEYARARYENGEIARSEYLKIKVIKGQAETAALAATAAAEAARITFFHTAGMKPVADLVFEDVPLPPRRELPPLATLIEEALTARPDVVKIREEKRRADLALKAADAAWFPAVAATASYDYSAAEAPARDNWDENSEWTVGLTASWDILNRLGTVAGHKKARAATLTADAAFNHVRDAVALDVTNAYYEYLRTAETVAIAEETADAAAEEYAAVQELYNSGGASSLELSDAQARYVDAANAAVKARYDFVAADYDLRRATGELTY